MKQHRSTWQRVVGRSLLGVLALLAACRGCDPHPAPTDPAPTNPATSPDASAGAAALDSASGVASEPDAEPEPSVFFVDVLAVPPPDAVVPDTRGSPNAALIEALTPFLTRLADTTLPLAQLTGALPPTRRQSATLLGGMFLRCMAVQVPAACQRMAAQDAEKCRVEAEQVAARQRGERGWVATPAFLSLCASIRLPEAQCRQYGESIETRNAGRCEGLALNDCPAMVAGDPAACAQIPGVDRSCPRQARFFGLLREGVAALQERGHPYYRPYTVGALQGPQQCAELVRNALHTFDQFPSMNPEDPLAGPAPAPAPAPPATPPPAAAP